MRPNFGDIPNYTEFSKYYWYKAELQIICKELKMEYIGNKQDLNRYIAAYFNGQRIPHQPKTSIKSKTEALTLETKIYDFGFACRNEYRPFFATYLGLPQFKYTANMVAAIKRVREEQDKTFTVKDLIDVYLGKSDYATYDKSACQWNQFYKAFCDDTSSKQYANKMKAAAILWSKVRDSTEKKQYSKEIYETYKILLTGQQK